MFVSRSMNGYGYSEEHQPVTYLRGYPIYAAHFIVLVFVVSMFVTEIALTFNSGQLLNWFPFMSETSKEIWRIGTYGLVNRASIWFAIDMLMIASFGRELEKVYGRHKFLQLFSCIYVLPPLLLTLLSPWLPSFLAGQKGALALFVGFATLYPNATMMFNLLAKWVAVVLVGIYTLSSLGNHDWPSLISLWSTAGFVYLYVQHQQGRLTLPSFKLLPRQPKLRVLPDLPKPKKTAGTKTVSESSMAEVDALLDKIAQSGISSLTAKERAQLDAAREDLRRKRQNG